ncbi:MAG: hypothetical protein WKG01_35330 [Kofleriaceae bacterium]
MKRRSPQSKRKTVRGEAPARGALGLAKQMLLSPIEDGDPLDGECLIEPAWDGHRVLATRVDADVRIAAADFRDWTQTFAAVTRALGVLGARSFAIDGVVCALDERGTPAFARLRDQVAKGAAGSAVLIAWDLMWLDDEDLRDQPLRMRRDRLRTLFSGAPAAVVCSQILAGELAKVVAAVAPLGFRGVVARRLDGGYAAAWRGHAVATDKLEWKRSLSPPPPLSNADKVLYPRDGICKRDIVGYYRDVAPLIIPHLIDRPVVTQRWVDGIDEFDWYQHRVPPRAPDYLRAAWVDGVRRILIENLDALLWMVNQAGIVFHGFGSRLASLAEPDYAMIDLDPGDRTTWWEETIEVALAVRRVLELLELPSLVKTSGQRGLHILIPVAPGHTFEQCETLGRGIAHLLLGLMPDKVTIENEKDKRKGRLLVDHKWFQAKTLVTAYSLRAADGAPVSTPIRWDEVTPKLAPRAFTLRTLRSRLDAHGDLTASLLTGTSRLDRALAQLRR